MKYFLIKYINEKSLVNGQYFIVFEDVNNPNFYYRKSLDNTSLIGGGALKKEYCEIQYDKDGYKIFVS